MSIINVKQAAVANTFVCFILIFLSTALLTSCSNEEQNAATNNATNKTAFITIAFDGADISQYFYSYILDSHNFNGVYCTPSGLIGGVFESYPLMSPEQLKELALQGHEIASQTLTKPNTNNITSAQYEYELIQSKEEIKSLGIIANNFCYPTIEDIKFKEEVTLYYDLAMSSEQGINELPVQDVFSLKSCGVTSENDAAQNCILQLEEQGGWLIILVGRINNNETIRTNTDITIEEYRELLEQIEDTGLPVITLEEALYDPRIIENRP